MGLQMALGTMKFGTHVDEATSFAILDRFAELGGEWLDTANIYAFWNDPRGEIGASESVIGAWRQANPGNRLKLATKCGIAPVDGQEEGLSRGAIERAVDGSLARLRADHLDLYFAHKVDPRTPFEETIAAFAGLCASGVVSEWGLSNHPTWRLEQARAWCEDSWLQPPTCTQVAGSLLTRRTDIDPGEHPFGQWDRQTLDWVEAHADTMVWLYCPVLRGAYARGEVPDAYDLPGNHARMEALRDISAESDLTPTQVALAWLVAQHPRAVPIVGVSSVAQLEEAATGITTQLTPLQIQRLSAGF